MNNYLSINIINEKTKKNLKSRSIFSILIVAYIVVLIIFFLIANVNPQWVKNNIVNQVFAWLILVSLLPIIFLITNEIRNIHFKKNIFALFFLFFCLIIVIYTPTLIYFLPMYKVVFLSREDQIFWFLISGLICFFFLLIVNIFYLWMQGLFIFKIIFVHLVSLCLSGGFILSFFFFGFVKGWVTLAILYIITACTDTFAYLSGMLFGKKKISPFISPNKTVAGFIGGILCSTIICICILIGLSFVPNQYNLLGNFFGIKFKYSINFLNANNEYANFPLWWLIVVVILIVLSILSVIGDLSFSYIKRMYGIKDFSNLIPGHGGILDRIDSLSFVFCSFLLFIIIINLFSTTSPLI